MGRLSYRQTDDMGAPVRPVCVGFGPIFRGFRHVLGLLAMTALAWACGSESACPSGTAGPACIPTDDLGSPPDVPTATRNRPIEGAETADVPDAGPLDALETDSTTQFKREVPDAWRPTLLTDPDPGRTERGGWIAATSGHVTEYERTTRCVVQTGDHAQSTVAAPGRPFEHVDRGGGPVGWRFAA